MKPHNKPTVVPFPAGPDAATKDTKEQRDAALTDALSDTERMASILSTLLEERIVDNGPRRSFTLSRKDADDIRFAGEQLLAMLTRAGDIWRAIP